MTRFTVGLVGAGPAAQAIHLPTLARHSDLFEVSAVMDIDPALACAVAAPIGAFHTTSLEELLARGGLDVVVIGSPNQFHATQIEAACAAGVRAILAEKPLVNAHGEIDAVLRALTASGTQLVVGAMHSYDPAWLAAQAAIEGAAGPWHVRCVCFIPGNERFEDAAATMVRPVEAASRSADAGPHPPPPTPAELIRGGVLGLAIHNLPHARVFVPELDGLLAARTVEPWGYTITAQGPAGVIEFVARTGGMWAPDWTFAAVGADAQINLDFPPSYVHRGSAVAEVVRRGEVRRFGPFDADGYDREWLEVAAILNGAAPRYDLDHLRADIVYALDLAEACAKEVAR